MMPRIVLSQAPEQTWRNGGGTTRELLAWPQAEGWSLRISVAQITRDGSFSTFAGVQRWFAVLRGEGVQLRWGEAATVLSPDDAPLVFEGAEPPFCELLGGPTQDLNLMLRSGAGHGWMGRGRLGDEWISPAPLRAVYSLDPVWLQIDDHDALELAADTLAWHEGAAQQRWRLRRIDTAGTDPVRALWMAFAPLPE